MNLKPGDLVTAAPYCLGSDIVFQIRYIKPQGYYLFIPKGEKVDDVAIECQQVCWKEQDLILIRTIESIVHEADNNCFKTEQDIIETTIKLFKEKKELYGWTFRNFSKNIPLQPLKLDLNKIYPSGQYISKEGELENMLKILDMYKNKQKERITKEYNEFIESVKNGDTITQIIKEMKSQIEAIAGDKINEYSFEFPGLYTEENLKAIKQLYNKKDEELLQLENTIKEIEALVELAPNYEEKIQILRDYGIIDKKKNIIL